MPRRATRSSPLHGIAALSALLAGFITLSLSLSHGSPASEELGEQAEIGVEHAEPLVLSIAMSTGKSQAIAELSHESEETIAVSIPSDWKEQEVRFRPLADVLADPPSFGFTRWHIPAGTHVRFLVPATPSNVLIHNPSRIPLQVNVRRINLITGQKDENVVLIKDKSVTLW